MTFKDNFPGPSRSWNVQEKNPGLFSKHGNPAIKLPTTTSSSAGKNVFMQTLDQLP